ncbi:PI phosphatase group protein [Sporothrix schenckii 1099-18]|uniref:Inositol polyphosphate-related phosphatase domain-containing protein n=2 Tax=Sporothrix schenckii TaxID=29908 RepID=U7PJ11_SPOS1|nr:PI phosphatase group protein [Sporothrix schenckii 1099-18]ERS95633.1 hypothetical protein HMPREF1624_08149 [Sporothrix schenckii ATCC 58251]KJR86652.1 PI phosphatase group protein [Sporothrix schenckii 1099-18]
MPPPPDEEGPDGSSIKPVSSLRARFENMGKPVVVGSPTIASPHPSPLPTTTLSRPISPAPKPDRLRGPASPILGDRPFAQAPPPPKPKPHDPSTASTSATPASPAHSPTWPVAASTPDSSISSLNLSGNAALLRPSNRLGPPPPLSPRPIAPPSLLVQPPQSPPKGRAGNLAPSTADQSNFFLNPDSVVKAPLSPSSSPRLPKIPSRPHTPTSLDTRRSPRLSPSQPPSPPPPRRSAELKRERDQRDVARDTAIVVRDATSHKAAAPPPINRTDKPKIPSQQFNPTPIVLSRAPTSPAAVSTTGSPPGTRSTADKLSPFSTPPSGDESINDDQPPMLPARPRSQLPPVERSHPKPRPRSMAVPPTSDQGSTGHHNAFGHVRQDKASNGVGARGPLFPQITGNGHIGVDTVAHRHENDDHRSARPPLPSRPTPGANNANNGQPPRAQIPASTRLPPKPPRPGVDTHVPTNGGSMHSARIAGIASSGTSGYDNQTISPSLAKRVVSNPTTSTQQFPPPPTRTQHGRSMTVDHRATPKFQSDFHGSNGSLVPGPGLASIRSGTSSPSDIASRSTDALVALNSLSKPHDNPSAAFPDATNVNRRPPFAKQGLSEINTRLDCRQVDVCGQRVVTTGQLTRVWSLVDGELLMSFAHGEGIRATCAVFKPGAHVDDEGLRVWIGNITGELIEADIATQSVVASRPAAHARHEIIRIHRHCNELWTMCDGGALYVWGPTEDAGVPSLASGQHQSFRLPRGHTFSIVVGDELWHASGKELRVFLPTVDGTAQFQVLLRPLLQDGAGEITSGTVLLSEPDKVYLGHSDGKVSIYSRTDYTCLGMVSLGSYKVNTLASAGPYIWAGFNTGRLSVYDPACSPWMVKKDWSAHDNPVVRLVSDRASPYRTGHMQVVSLGADNVLRIWDGLLQDDWIEEAMQTRDKTYCDFDTIRAHVMTWNAGASTPGSLRYSDDDASFMQNMLRDSGSPDILVFGFQELVDLEDKTATAKRILKVKKKEGSDQERMSHQYRDWRDFLVRCLDDFMNGELYQLLQTAHMVGLFTCIFVKADLRDRIRNVAIAEVKRGMGGLHGNKGAIAIRFLLDDTSMCFVNCHLAAGQSQATSRHNDAAAILDSTGLPMERDTNTRIDSYIGGGDGTMILDHELCILNGDLNYRIDTMSRDTVVTAVKAGNLAKLLDRDQLLVARRRNAGFRLRAFDELPIRFDPTYKYDVGTDNYDSSEKKRSPAWCDRLLFRGGHGARVRQLDYRRHEVRVSDHRPVTGRFELTVKHVDAKRRAVAWMESQQRLDDHRDEVCHQEKMYYLTHIIGYDEATSENLIRERTNRRVRRSPSRHRD